jgi:pimeloyl-ACP methyl ester carboxylesterase
MEVDRDDDLILVSTPGRTEPAIVAFSARDAKPRQFHFFHLSKFFPDSPKVLVRDPSATWYNSGLPGIGDSVGEVAEGIRREVTRLGAERILTIGMSMGGYAAILFGCLTGAERAIALVPQTLLDPRFPQRRPSADVKLEVPDLRPVIRDAPRTKIDLVSAWDDLLDVFHAQRVAEFPSVRVLGVPGEHDFLKGLRDRDEFWPFITELVKGDLMSVCETKSQFDQYIIDCLGDAAFALGRGDRTGSMRSLIPIAERYPDWAAPDLVAVRSLLASTP